MNIKTYIHGLSHAGCTMDRRQFIVAASTTSAIAMAGCLHGDGGGDADTSSPTALVESYYEAIDDLDSDMSSEDALNELDDFFHSESPIRDLIEEGGDEESDGEQPDRSLSSVSTEVTDEDLSADALDQRFGLSFFGASQEAIESFAEENAVVSVEVEYEDADTQNQEHLTATEGGDWQIVL